MAAISIVLSLGQNEIAFACVVCSTRVSPDGEGPEVPVGMWPSMHCCTLVE